MKQQKTFYPSDKTIEQMRDLADHWGLPLERHNTDVIERCVDQVWTEEIKRYSVLEASIRRNGVTAPVLIDENGVVLDGRTRVRIARKLGIDIPVRRIPASAEIVDPDDLTIV